MPAPDGGTIAAALQTGEVDWWLIPDADLLAPLRRDRKLSVRITGHDAGPVTGRLRHEFGVFADARRPDVIRLAPTPMYNTFHDCWRAASALAAVLGD